jgi:hypothetical protein
MAAAEERVKARLEELKLALQFSEARFHNVINRGADGILIIDEGVSNGLFHLHGAFLFAYPEPEI